MNAVIYARYSSDNQREESIEGQLRECMAFAERSGLTIVGTYIDRAYSAKTDDRPEFQRMIKDSPKGLFEAVVVWKLDRFSRNRYDSAYYKMTLKKNGVRVISATETISDGQEGIILESMLEGIAEFYSAELAVKVTRGMTENALKCKFNGGPAPLGYMIDEEQHYRIDPTTSPLVLEIFTRYADGEPAARIIKDLNQRGLHSSGGAAFTQNGLRSVIKNRRYVGEYRHGGTVIPDGIPAIVPSELFDKAHQRMENNKRKPAAAKAKEEYLLTTKLYCGECQSFMVGESGKSKQGVTYHYYKCIAAKRGRGCHKKAVRKDWIERLIVEETIHKVLVDPVIDCIADAIIREQDIESSLLPVLRQQQMDNKRALANMLRAIEQGVITDSTKQRLEELEQAQKELELAILQEQLQKPRLTKEQLVLWISNFKGGDINDLSYRKRIIDSFVNAVYVYDDRLVLTYNCKDGSQTIALKDIKNSDLDKNGSPKNAC